MVRLVIAVAALFFMFACSQDSGDSGSAEQPSEQQATEEASRPSQGRPAIDTEEFSEFEKIVDGRILPYFDEKGTVSSKELGPNEYFDLWVFAEFNKLYPINAGEYKLVLPEGVSILGSVQSDSTILSLGKWEEDFMISFKCMGGPSQWLVKYQCKTHEDYKGGTVQTIKGQNMNFIGFTLCDASFTMVRARGGKAEMKLK